MDIRCNNCFEIYDGEFDMCPFCGYCKGDPAEEAFFLLPGTVLNERYTVGKSLGFGGFGIIYKAWDNQLDSIVAIKEFYPSGIVNRPPGTNELILFSGEKRKEFEFGLTRFIDEAINTIKFSSHENIVNVYEYFEENNTAYFVMEYLEGRNLKKYIADNGGKLSLEESLQITLSVCNALKDVHANGIIHRDISPDNIYLCNNGAIKLIDFGAARFSSETEENRTIILKPGYAPAEQYEQVSSQGPKTDIYALGATLYYMITGTEPEESTNRKVKDNLAEPNEIDSTIPLFVNDTIMRAMAMEQSLRFESIEEFEKALKEEISVISPHREKVRRKRKRFAGISALISVLLVIAVIFGLNVNKKSESIKLEDAEISVWYSAEKDDALDKAYRKVIKEFNEEYKNVKINIKCISPSAYGPQLQDAIISGKSPSLFMTTDEMDINLSGAEDISTVLFPEDQGKIYFLVNRFLAGSVKDYYFLSDYEKLFPEHNRIPSSFNIPVLYVNKSALSVGETESISSYSDIAGYVSKGAKIVVDPDFSSSVYSALGIPQSGNIITGDVNKFISGEYAFFLSDTSNYFTIRKMPSMGTGVPQVISIAVDNLPCTFCTYWSVGKGNENATAAAERLLEFFLTANAQSNIYGKSSTEQALPINKEALTAMDSVYEDLGFIEKDIKNYTIDK